MKVFYYTSSAHINKYDIYEACNGELVAENVDFDYVFIIIELLNKYYAESERD